MVKTEYEGEFGETINRPMTDPRNIQEMDAGVLFNRVGEVTILDVREKGDYAAEPSMIEGAIRVDPDNLSWLDGYSKNTLYVLYCKHPNCDTSRRIAGQMRARGFNNVQILRGGIDAWAKAGHPLSSEQ
ncbi:rhodanese-like domain-containing protein [Desulfocurvibacter africanus]|uniref:rhodanese-like domain-containing protein n=1 Tax=Desulfocurvibacter africanus TaxID=873 RepID=UPI0002F01864|nr:rhodanese-like domain-containing protein [Desulfocurvibacter africanus]